MRALILILQLAKLVSLLDRPQQLLILLPLVALLLLLVADVGIRHAGLYAAADGRWQKLGRVVSIGRREGSAYREGSPEEWLPAVPAGIPGRVSYFLLPVLGMVLVWCVGSLLALCDFKDVFLGERDFGFVSASFLLCAVRAVSGGLTLLAAYQRREGLFWLGSALAIGLDAILACELIPCSDHQADDVRVACAGLVTQTSLALGFAWAAWQRRGLVADPQLAESDED